MAAWLRGVLLLASCWAARGTLGQDRVLDHPLEHPLGGEAGGQTVAELSLLSQVSNEGSVKLGSAGDVEAAVGEISTIAIESEWNSDDKLKQRITASNGAGAGDQSLRKWLKELLRNQRSIISMLAGQARGKNDSAKADSGRPTSNRPSASPSSPPVTLGAIEEVYNACAKVGKLPDRAVQDACAALGYRRTGTRTALDMPIVQVKDRPKHDMKKQKRAALCVVGQMRTFPLACSNWQEHLVPIMETGDTELDLYVITSNSSSYQLSEGILDSLPLAGKIVVTNVNFLFRPAETWAWRDRKDTATKMPGSPAAAQPSIVEFNMANFPQGRISERDKEDTFLIQNWQEAKCKEMILQAEKKHQFKYLRVARMRTDSLFVLGASGCKVEGPPESCFAVGVERSERAGRCISAMAAFKAKRVSACQRGVSQSESKKQPWVIKTGDTPVGSRDEILNKAFVGLEKLSAKINRNSTHSWNNARFHSDASPPAGCGFAAPTLRMSWGKPTGQWKAAVNLEWPGEPWGAENPEGVQLKTGTCPADPTPEVASDLFKLAMMRHMPLPTMLDAVRCLEIGVCNTRGGHSCNVHYGEAHVHVKAGKDTEFRAGQFADAFGAPGRRVLETGGTSRHLRDFGAS
jgi:hypothetical protein